MKISICKTIKNFDQLLDSSCRLAIFGGWGEGTKKECGERWEAEYFLFAPPVVYHAPFHSPPPLGILCGGESSSSERSKTLKIIYV